MAKKDSKTTKHTRVYFGQAYYDNPNREAFVSPAQNVERIEPSHTQNDLNKSKPTKSTAKRGRKKKADSVKATVPILPSSQVNTLNSIVPILPSPRVDSMVRPGLDLRTQVSSHGQELNKPNHLIREVQESQGQKDSINYPISNLEQLDEMALRAQNILDEYRATKNISFNLNEGDVEVKLKDRVSRRNSPIRGFQNKKNINFVPAEAQSVPLEPGGSLNGNQNLNLTQSPLIRNCKDLLRNKLYGQHNSFTLPNNDVLPQVLGNSEPDPSRLQDLIRAQYQINVQQEYASRFQETAPSESSQPPSTEPIGIFYPNICNPDPTTLFSDNEEQGNLDSPLVSNGLNPEAQELSSYDGSVDDLGRAIPAFSAQPETEPLYDGASDADDNNNNNMFNRPNDSYSLPPPKINRWRSPFPIDPETHIIGEEITMAQGGEDSPLTTNYIDEAFQSPAPGVNHATPQDLNYHFSNYNVLNQNFNSAPSPADFYFPDVLTPSNHGASPLQAGRSSLPVADLAAPNKSINMSEYINFDSPEPEYDSDQMNGMSDHDQNSRFIGQNEILAEENFEEGIFNNQRGAFDFGSDGSTFQRSEPDAIDSLPPRDMGSPRHTNSRSKGNAVIESENSMENTEQSGGESPSSHYNSDQESQAATLAKNGKIPMQEWERFKNIIGYEEAKQEGQSSESLNFQTNDQNIVLSDDYNILESLNSKPILPVLKHYFSNKNEFTKANSDEAIQVNDRWESFKKMTEYGGATTPLDDLKHNNLDTQETRENNEQLNNTSNKNHGTNQSSSKANERWGGFKNISKSGVSKSSVSGKKEGNIGLRSLSGNNHTHGDSGWEESKSLPSYDIATGDVTNDPRSNESSENDKIKVNKAWEELKDKSNYGAVSHEASDKDSMENEFQSPSKNYGVKANKKWEEFKKDSSYIISTAPKLEDKSLDHGSQTPPESSGAKVNKGWEEFKKVSNYGVATEENFEDLESQDPLNKGGDKINKAWEKFKRVATEDASVNSRFQSPLKYTGIKAIKGWEDFKKSSNYGAVTESLSELDDEDLGSQDPLEVIEPRVNKGWEEFKRVSNYGIATVTGPKLVQAELESQGSSPDGGEDTLRKSPNTELSDPKANTGWEEFKKMTNYGKAIASKPILSSHASPNTPKNVASGLIREEISPYNLPGHDSVRTPFASELAPTPASNHTTQANPNPSQSQIMSISGPVFGPYDPDSPPNQVANPNLGSIASPDAESLANSLFDHFSPAALSGSKRIQPSMNMNQINVAPRPSVIYSPPSRPSYPNSHPHRTTNTPLININTSIQPSNYPRDATSLPYSPPNSNALTKNITGNSHPLCSQDQPASNPGQVEIPGELLTLLTSLLRKQGVAASNFNLTNQLNNTISNSSEVNISKILPLLAQIHGQKDASGRSNSIVSQRKTLSESAPIGRQFQSGAPIQPVPARYPTHTNPHQANISNPTRTPFTTPRVVRNKRRLLSGESAPPTSNAEQHYSGGSDCGNESRPSQGVIAPTSTRNTEPTQDLLNSQIPNQRFAPDASDSTINKKYFGYELDPSPLVASSHLSQLLGCEVLLKMEHTLPGNSHKIRGMLDWMAITSRCHGPGVEIEFVITGSPNRCFAAQAAMTRLHTLQRHDPHSRLANTSLTCLIPFGYCSKFEAKLTRLGVKVIKDWDDCIKHIGLYLQQAKLLYSSHSDLNHPDSLSKIWLAIPSATSAENAAGMESVGHELDTQLNGIIPDTIICPVGSGSLLAGLVQGLASNSYLASVPILAVETHSTNTLQKSVAADHLVTIPSYHRKWNRITASKLPDLTSLGDTSLNPLSLKATLTHPIIPLAVSDAMAANAICLFSDEQKILVEPACGAVLSTIYHGILPMILPKLQSTSKVVIIITGGNQITGSDVINYQSLYANPTIHVRSGDEVYSRLPPSPPEPIVHINKSANLTSDQRRTRDQLIAAIKGAKRRMVDLPTVNGNRGERVNLETLQKKHKPIIQYDP